MCTVELCVCAHDHTDTNKQCVVPTPLQCLDVWMLTYVKVIAEVVTRLQPHALAPQLCMLQPPEYCCQTNSLLATSGLIAVHDQHLSFSKVDCLSAGNLSASEMLKQEAKLHAVPCTAFWAACSCSVRYCLSLVAASASAAAWFSLWPASLAAFLLPSNAALAAFSLPCAALVRCSFCEPKLAMSSESSYIITSRVTNLSVMQAPHRAAT